MITAIGTDIGEEFNLAGARYHKIVAMTDADHDGAHIRTLLLTFLFRHMRELIEAGYVYIAQPPLYRVKIGRKEHYIKTDAELEKVLLPRSSATRSAIATGASRLHRDPYARFAGRCASTTAGRRASGPSSAPQPSTMSRITA